MNSFSYGQPPPNIKGMFSLKVDNLTYRTTPDDLRRVFEKYGTVGDVYIPRDRWSKESRGFAFVRFHDKHDAEDAMNSLDGRSLDGRELRVQMARYGRPQSPGPRGRGRRSRSTSRDRGRDRRRRSYSGGRHRSRSASPRRRPSRSPRRRTRSRSISPIERRARKSRSRSASPRPKDASPGRASRSRSRSVSR